MKTYKLETAVKMVDAMNKAEQKTKSWGDQWYYEVVKLDDDMARIDVFNENSKRVVEGWKGA